ncbi:hypothetical protein A3F07_01165 [candidate division WWE3 bacterium RIFCSPHIGHO2_12_FULL_38_15]|nr:MAG: hypothetical protein A3F07_01165 [candidate division WWE3 bacterium RIFCSPHIGHO2_12_FULL_38_15]HLB51445.1 UDP-N-acetylglucosamine 1-carboxyvinyltransferase [Patescibacteria group bacterium]
MPLLEIEGGIPLIGNVHLSGSRNSSVALIPAALFSNDDIVIDNVPKFGAIDTLIAIIKSLGGKAEWISKNKLLINGASLETFEVPYELGSVYRNTGLLAGPLMFRFGQAVLPKQNPEVIVIKPINRWVDSWRSLGVDVKEDDKYYYLKAEQITGTTINFKVNTHMGTGNAILSSIFGIGETTIINAAEESEINDLISFCNLIGAEIDRIEPRKIRILGKRIFRGTSFKVQNDINEAVAFAVGALVTNGNISIKGVEKSGITSFTNVLTKMGANFEFSGDEMRVWHANEELKPVEINTAPAPGFMTHWKSLLVLLATKANGVSIIHDTVYINRFEFTKDLNRMGAKIEILKPSEVNLIPVISDDYYDFNKSGEPYTVARVTGPTKLKGVKSHIIDLRSGAVLVLAALYAEGKSEIGGFEYISRGFEDFFEKFGSLGAKFSYVN